MNFSLLSKNFRRLKNSNKLNMLYLGVSSVMLIASILLILVFRHDLEDTYLKKQPRFFNIARFEPNKQYLIAKNDYLVGKSKSTDKIKIVMYEPKIVLKTEADINGNWRIQLPETLSEKPYKLALVVFDSNGKNPQLKLYRVRVTSNYKFTSSRN